MKLRFALILVMSSVAVNAHSEVQTSASLKDLSYYECIVSTKYETEKELYLRNLSVLASSPKSAVEASLAEEHAIVLSPTRIIGGQSGALTNIECKLAKK
jgi:hypothetical protein